MRRLGNSLDLDPFLDYRKTLLKKKEQYLKTIFAYIEFFRDLFPSRKSWVIVKEMSGELETFWEIERRTTLLINDICNALAIVEERNHSGNDIQFLYRVIRFCTLALSNQLVRFKNLMSYIESRYTFIEGTQSSRKRADETIERLLDNSLKIYVVFTLAEVRIAGQYPPCEGILLIKEYKK
jgi:hypothetical protein